jgi:2,4-dienoyl-CoA reductase-like NADH-dependent reductase (Old Yellow Enzyme family)
MIKGAEAVASANKNIHIVSSGLSYLSSSIANVAAACIEESKFSMAGIGRLTLAYPDYARDIINYGYPRLSQLCITCGKCTELMRSGRTPGCVIRDRDIYLPLYRELEIERRNMQ